MMEFVWIMLIIVGGAALMTWIISGCPAPKTVNHYHYHKYKRSTDYERLWDLIVNKGEHVIIDHGTSPFRYGEALRGEYSENNIYGIGENIYVSDGKEKFINYCQWKGIKFLDIADEVIE